MKILTLNAPTGKCIIELGVPLAGIGAALGGRHAIAITDSTVRRLYHDRLYPLESIDIDATEAGKTLGGIEKIYDGLIERHIDRATVLVGIGGGVTLDITGFVASTCLRGLSFIYAPTTLLAQADAAVGGKNGVNHRGYKNMVGAFAQPEMVVCDHSVLDTLGVDDRRGGLMEIVKHAVIGNERLFCRLENRTPDVLALEPALVEEIVSASLEVKIRIVSLDEKESGLRRKLNLGHTIGHAIEKASHISHGDAVGAGLAFAARFANRLGKLSGRDMQRILEILTRLSTPAKAPVEKKAVKDAILKDKKREGPKLHFVFPEGIGRCVVEDIPIGELEEAIDDLC